MPFGTDDPNVQELLARNASMDSGAPVDISGLQNRAPSGFGIVPQPPPPQPQIDQKPGGVKRFLQGMLGGMADAAMKESTGMNFTERQLAQQEIQQKRLQNQYYPQEVQAKLAAQSAQPRFSADGQFLGMWNNDQYKEYLRGAAGAEIKAQASKDVANTQAASKMNVAQLQMAIAQHKSAHYIPDVDPQTHQMFYKVMNPYGQEIGRTDVGAISSLMQKTSSTTEYKDDGNGNIIALPKTTTSGPVIPGAQGATPTPSRTGGAAAGPRVVAPGKPVGMVVGSDSQGRQVAGTPAEMRSAGVSQFVKLDGAEAAKVNTARQMTSPNGLFGLIDKDLAKFHPGELETLSPRWNEFLTGKYGTGDPRYVALRTHVNGLLSTALMQAHVGARGGEHLMEHFQDMANAGKMSLPTLKAALDAERQYVEEKAMRPGSGGFTGGGHGINIKRDANGRITGIE